MVKKIFIKDGNKASKKAEPVEERDVDLSALDDEVIEESDMGEDAGDLDSSVEQELPPSPNFGGEDGSDSAELEKLRAENEENRTKYIRSLADFENYKKRALKERSDLLKYQGERILRDMLDIADNLELALQHSQAEPEKLRQGIEMINKMFQDTLSKWEVRGESAVGKQFDPNSHSALSKVAVPGTPSGTVVNELRKAYFYKDKLLRPAEVVVAESNQSEGGSEEKSEEPALTSDEDELNPENVN